MNNDRIGAATQPADPRQDTHVPPAVVGGLPESKVRRVVAFVETNLHRPLRLEDLAAVTHMSPYHFARLFKRATGISPHRFVVRRRIDAATVLLTGSASSISSIARAVGFRTASHFATTVRRVTGMTPSAYRARTAAAEPPVAPPPVPAAAAGETVPTLPK